MNLDKSGPALLLLLSAVTFLATAQSPKRAINSILSSQMIVLHYNNPKDSFRKPFNDTLNIPVANDDHHRLRDSLAAKLYFGDSLESIKANFDTCACGITGLDYKTTFESKNIIALKLYYETEAAYPSSFQTWLVFDVRTGAQYQLSKEINPAGLNWLIKHYKNVLLSRIRAKRDIIKADFPDDYPGMYNQLVDGVNMLTPADLFHFYVFTKDGVELSMEQISPHATAANDPVRDLLIPYAKLKHYLAPGSIVIKSAK